jgi:hypothetical protein
MLGLAGLCGAALHGAESTRSDAPLAPKPPHFPGRAKRVIHIFANGGASHVDTFDPKPSLTRYHGQALPMENLKTERRTGAAFASPLTFRKYGQSGIEVSDLFPKVADQLELGDDNGGLAAMGFLTVGRRFLNNQHDIIDDRIDVVFRGLQGLTVTCARCHDHKFEPIPTSDYYSLYGVFASSEEPDDKPVLKRALDPDAQAQFAVEQARLQAVLLSGTLLSRCFGGWLTHARRSREERSLSRRGCP